MIYVLDTHTLAWYGDNDQRLSPKAFAIIDSPGVELVIPTLVLVELQYLFVKGRIQTDPTVIQQQVITAKNCIIHPLDEKVVTKIPIGLDIHDAIIVATAITYRDDFQQPTTLITKDGAITHSGLIQTLW